MLSRGNGPRNGPRDVPPLIGYIAGTGHQYSVGWAILLSNTLILWGNSPGDIPPLMGNGHGAILPFQGLYVQNA